MGMGEERMYEQEDEEESWEMLASGRDMATGPMTSQRPCLHVHDLHPSGQSAFQHRWGGSH